mmetsp:Transcript_6147/g.14274  ORF Transcript_6147/g.14274 Transcript_6147/m.14274 type:complete len:306 (-) Transcript_6147:232-1149(-)
MPLPTLVLPKVMLPLPDEFLVQFVHDELHTRGCFLVLVNPTFARQDLGAQLVRHAGTLVHCHFLCKFLLGCSFRLVEGVVVGRILLLPRIPHWVVRDHGHVPEVGFHAMQEWSPLLCLGSRCPLVVVFVPAAGVRFPGHSSLTIFAIIAFTAILLVKIVLAAVVTLRRVLHHVISIFHLDPIFNLGALVLLRHQAVCGVAPDAEALVLGITRFSLATFKSISGPAQVLAFVPVVPAGTRTSQCASCGTSHLVGSSEPPRHALHKDGRRMVDSVVADPEVVHFRDAHEAWTTFHIEEARSIGSNTS